METKIDEISAADFCSAGMGWPIWAILFPWGISSNKLSKDCPTGTPIPSETTVLFAFTPKISYIKAAKLYKNQFQLKFKVQSRQLRSSHVDDHYCVAKFRYMRQYTVSNREVTTFLCVDDKSKIDYGEPNHAISPGARGKKSVIPISTVLGALDHDVNSKRSYTPSVSLEVEILDELDSFYWGQITVALEGSVLQPSSPFCHATEIKELLQDHVKPALMIYSDGGPDHRLTYHSVQLSLISVFVNLDLDMLIAARTAPGQLGESSRAVDVSFKSCLLERGRFERVLQCWYEKKAQEVHRNGGYSKIICKCRKI